MAQAELLVCVNRRFTEKASCAARGSEAIVDALEQALGARNIPLKVERTPCQSCCERGPTVRLLPGPRLFLGMTLDDVPRVVAEMIDHLASCGIGPVVPEEAIPAPFS